MGGRLEHLATARSAQHEVGPWAVNVSRTVKGAGTSPGLNPKRRMENLGGAECAGSAQRGCAGSSDSNQLSTMHHQVNQTRSQEIFKFKTV